MILRWKSSFHVASYVDHARLKKTGILLHKKYPKEDKGVRGKEKAGWFFLVQAVAFGTVKVPLLSHPLLRHRTRNSSPVPRIVHQGAKEKDHSPCMARGSPHASSRTLFVSLIV